MSDNSEKKPDTLHTIPVFEDGGIAIHHAKDHSCVLPYKKMRDGENIAGQSAVQVHPDGTYEMIDTGGGVKKGPCQVSTEAYRRGWEQTFGARGGVS